MRIGIEGKEFELSLAGSIDESRVVTPHALTIDVGKSSDEGTLRFDCFRTHQQIQKAIYQSFFRAGCIRSRDHQIAQGNQRFILMGIDKNRLPVWTLELFRGVVTSRELAGGGGRNGRAGANGSEYGDTQEIAAVHN